MDGKERARGKKKPGQRLQVLRSMLQLQGQDDRASVSSTSTAFSRGGAPPESAATVVAATPTEPSGPIQPAAPKKGQPQKQSDQTGTQGDREMQRQVEPPSEVKPPAEVDIGADDPGQQSKRGRRQRGKAQAGEQGGKPQESVAVIESKLPGIQSVPGTPTQRSFGMPPHPFSAPQVEKIEQMAPSKPPVSVPAEPVTYESHHGKKGKGKQPKQGLASLPPDERQSGQPKPIESERMAPPLELQSGKRPKTEPPQAGQPKKQQQQGKGRDKGKGQTPQDAVRAPQPPQQKASDSGDRLARSKEPPMQKSGGKKLTKATVTDVTKELASDLKIESSTAHLKPPVRPGLGKKGQPIMLYTNFYKLSFKDIDIFHYDIDIMEVRGERRDAPRDKALKRRIFEAIIRTHFVQHVNRVVYDGNKNVYAAQPIMNERQRAFQYEMDGKNFNVTIQITGNGNGTGGRISLLDLRNLIMSTPEDPRTRDFNFMALNVLDVVLRQMLPDSINVGRNKFLSFPDWSPGLVQGEGYFSSVRPGWKYLFVQMDVATKIFHKEQTLIEFLQEMLNCREINLNTLNHYQEREIKEKITGLKVEMTHLPYRRTYCLVKLTNKSAAQQTFNMDLPGGGKRQITVQQYFRETYNMQLRYPHLPCAHAAPESSQRYFPLEVCKVKKGQQYNRLTDKQKADLIKASAIPAPNRKRQIDDMMETRKLDADRTVQQFGLHVEKHMTQLEGRVLKPPYMEYSGRNSKIEPRDGSWNLRNTGFFQGGGDESLELAVINFAYYRDERQLDNFIGELCRTARELGIQFPKFMKDVIHCEDDLRDIERAFNTLKNKYPKLGFIIFVLGPKNATPKYNECKRLGDIIYGIPTQGVQQKNVERINPQTLGNLCQKINAKLNGVNGVVERSTALILHSKVMNTPAIIFGADVTHPSPGDSRKPSVAAVVASWDRNATKYHPVIGIQGHRVEIISNLQAHVHSLLMHFYRENNSRKPDKIIFYRDGVSEGQFDQVIIFELSAIQRACQQLEANYQPKITLIVVQKRHHTRFFPVNPKDASGKAGNVPPGTTVDHTITHPIEFDFYLNSHQGIQGTCRPAHYHVLWDDNEFLADELQELTFQLCHVYSRCTRSVSIPAPAYYAHLVAFRARAYLDRLEENGLLPTNTNQLDGALKEINRLCQPHASLKGMFFS